MSIHYLFKLEMLIAHVLLLSCYRKTPEFIPPQLWPPNSPDLNPVDNSCEILQEKVYKTRITDLGLSTTPLTYGRRNDEIVVVVVVLYSPNTNR